MKDFASYINYLKQEIRALKQGKQKAANTLAVWSTTATLTFTIAQGSYSLVPTKIACITTTAVGDSTPLQQIYINEFNNIYYSVKRYPSDNSQMGYFEILPTIFDLAEGDTITVPITIVATQRLTYNITYEDNPDA